MGSWMHWMAAAWICGWGVMAGAAELPPIMLPVCSQAPEVDGALDEAVWQSGAKISHLYLLNSGAPAPETAIWLLRDNAWLYVGARCANTNMARLAQTAQAHDGAVNNDDSLELFVRPSPDPGAIYYHFLLSFANVRKEQRCNQAGLRDTGWNPYWRSATRRQADGWTAELAIPWVLVAGKDLSGLHINIARNMTQIELDQYGAISGEQRVYSALRPDNQGGFHNPANFQKVGNLAGFKPEPPDIPPRIMTAEVHGWKYIDGATCYGLSLSLDCPPKPDAIKVRVEDENGGGTPSACEFVWQGRAQTIHLAVPSTNYQERALKVQLVDAASGEVLSEKTPDNLSGLNIIRKAYAGRSYYTSERVAAIHVELDLPPEITERLVLTLEVGGKAVAERAGLKPAMVIEAPVSALPMGRNPAQVRVARDGRQMAARSAQLVRLAARPGYETKADFVRGVVLKDGEPFFPVGLFVEALQQILGAQDPWDKNSPVCAQDDEPLFRYLAEDIGLNAIARSKHSTNTAAFMSLAEKYGLNVIHWTSPQPRPIGMKPGTWPPPPCDLPLAERLAIQQKEYDAQEPGLIADTESAREYKNTIVYYGVDEPNLVNPEERIVGAERYWNTVTALDPYRPHILAYSAHIPTGDRWTRWCDILAYDIYPRPFQQTRGGIRSEPGLSTAYYAWQLRERCRRDNKIMWFVPLASQLDPGRTPIGMDQSRMLCQAYVAMIYGARGLLYFALQNVIGEGAWDALRTIGAQVRAMTPALVNGDVAQNIKYTPDDLRPVERKFPMVNAAIFAYPDGDHLMLAANIMPYAVDTAIAVGGLAGAARLFGAESGSGKGAEARSDMKLSGESFTDKIEAYGTRAYRLRLRRAAPGDAAGPVEVGVAMTPMTNEAAPGVDVTGIIQRVRQGKNHMPNPCFARQFNPGIPDFVRPLHHHAVDPFWGQKGRSDWYVDDTVLWNGRSSLRMCRQPLNHPGFNYHTIGIFGVFYPPAKEAPRKLTFSFYARSENPAANIWISIEGGFQRVGRPANITGLSAEWKRFHMTFEMAPKIDTAIFHLRPSFPVVVENAPVWISGLQIEEGETPTEFQDDAMPPPG